MTAIFSIVCFILVVGKNMNEYDNYLMSAYLQPFEIPFKVTDDYAKDDGPEVVWYLCGFYQDPLRSYLYVW